MKRPQKRARRQRRQGAEPAQQRGWLRPCDVRPFDVDAAIGARHVDLMGLGRRVTGIDTCEGVSDDDIALALIEEPILLCAAKRLSEQCGRTIARSDVADRIAASERLRHVHNVAEAFHQQLRLARAEQAIAAYGEAEHARELAREARQRRNRGPRCGAKTRSGRPCQRKPVLHKDRCPNHGGLSSGPTTEAGKAQSAENRRKRWAGRRAQK